MKKRKGSDGYTAEFEQFWKAYPYRRGSKWNAFRRFQGEVERGVHPSEIIAAAGRYAAAHFQKETEPRYVPHATTWLLGRGWESIEDFEAEAAVIGCGKLDSKTSPAEHTRRAVEEWLRPVNDSGKLRIQPEVRRDRLGALVNGPG